MRFRWLVPPPPFRGLLVRRASLLWLFARLFIALLVFYYEGLDALRAEAVRLGAPAGLALAGLVAAITLLDVYRRREAILLANLGVGPAGVVIVALLPTLALEALTWLAPV
jgi:hypothetical protein